MNNIPATATRKWDTVVELTDVVKYFDQVRPISLFKREKCRIHALDGVSFTLQKGEFAAYAGPNGAGKSTLMSMLFGMYEPDEGEIYVRGKKEVISSPNYATDLNIGMVHQHFMLVDSLTAAENIVLGQYLFKLFYANLGII